MKKFAKINLWLAVLLFPLVVFSAMSSTNYYIYADSVETGGGLSTGGNYSLEDTLGEGLISETSGPSYTINAGYQAMVLGSLSMNVSNSAINLGNLSTTAVVSDNTTITITTDSSSGYVMSVSSNSWTGTPLVSVSDGEVTAGQEEYGLALIGDDVVTTTDRGIIDSLPLALNSGPVSGKQTTLVFKAAISPSTVAGSRSHSVNVGVSANF